jgi:hypothetical protein
LIPQQKDRDETTFSSVQSLDAEKCRIPKDGTFWWGFFCFGLFVGGVCNDDQRRLLDYVRRDPATSASSLVVVVQAAEE